jgi:hypothetical protein
MERFGDMPTGLIKAFLDRRRIILSMLEYGL